MKKATVRLQPRKPGPPFEMSIAYGIDQWPENGFMNLEYSGLVTIRIKFPDRTIEIATTQDNIMIIPETTKGERS